MASMFSSPKSGPSQSEIIAQQEASAKRERDRLAAETAAKEADSKQKALQAVQDAESARRSLVSGVVSEEQDIENRRKFLKAV